MSWEMVIGLEVHVHLRTAEKLFCSDRTVFGAAPNSQVCPVCLGLPGALPVLNGEAVDLAITAALGLDCQVHEVSVFARKSYFYPDLPLPRSPTTITSGSSAYREIFPERTWTRLSRCRYCSWIRFCTPAGRPCLRRPLSTPRPCPTRWSE